jgi:restriction endonuclease S subunit
MTRQQIESNDFRQPLNHIANIRTGHTFRGRIVENPVGEVPVVQIRDLRRCLWIASDQLSRIERPKEKSVAPARPGDILLPARGEHYHAAILQGDEPAIATNQLYILEPKSKRVNTEFLGWYLNQRAAQHYFKTHRSGSNISMLNITSLGALPVPLPTIDIQDKIVRLYRTWIKERAITESLLNNREIQLTAIFQRLLES